MKAPRRDFIIQAGLITAGISYIGISSCFETKKNASFRKKQNEKMNDDLFFRISLAEWSLNKSIFSGRLDHLDFAEKSVKDFGIDAVEYSSQFFQDKAEDMDYLLSMKQRAQDHDVKSLLIMVDNEGELGALDDKKRMEAVENHYKWVDAADFLGCHSIRVNAFGEGTDQEVGLAVAEGLSRLSEYALKVGINILVENHGKHSSNGAWLANVMKNVGMDNCGTLPDFGNFCMKRDNGKRWGGNCIEEYDRYKGVKEMMPFAKAISAKSHDFDKEGMEIQTDYVKMLQIIKDEGYKGYIGIEYEGEILDAETGIKATRDLLIKTGKMLN